MARRVNQKSGDEALPAEYESKNQNPGGSLGVIPDAVNTITEPGKASASAMREPDPDAPPPPKVARFEVMNGNQYGPGQIGIMVVLDGAKVLLRKGKVIDDTTYDLPLLKRQHVQLRELV